MNNLTFPVWLQHKAYLHQNVYHIPSQGFFLHILVSSVPLPGVVVDVLAVCVLELLIFSLFVFPLCSPPLHAMINFLNAMLNSFKQHSSWIACIIEYTKFNK